MFHKIMFFFVSVWMILSEIQASPLVSPETVKLQKKLTTVFTLKNGIKVIYRKINNSEITELTLNYPFGIVDLPKGQKAFSSILFDLMPKAAKGYPKQKIYALQEKYSGGVSCSHGISLSRCSLATVNEFWDTLLPVMVAVTQSPTYPDEDLKLAKDAKIADIERMTHEPSAFVNQVINRVYYPDGHPYKLSYKDEIEDMKSLKAQNLKAIHKRVRKVKGQYFTYVGSLPLEKVKKDLEAAFGKIALAPKKQVVVTQPAFKADQAIAVEDRPIPTAYLSMKFNGPGRKDPDYLATQFMLRILSEELTLEIRTNRSLSYSVHSYMIGHDIGIGVISASTSKPKETLAAIDEIVAKMKTRKYTKEELNRYRNVYTTSYFLTLEEHSALSRALSSVFFYHHSLDGFYERPMLLEAITSEDLDRVAKKYLVNFRLGIIFDKSQFKEKWAKSLIDRHKSGQ